MSLLALKEKISSFSTCYLFMLYTCNVNILYARYDMNIYRLINEYVFYVYACLQYIYIYIYIFYGVGGFRLKRNLSNFLPKIRNTCIDYF